MAAKGEELPPCAPSRSVGLVGLGDGVTAMGESLLRSILGWLTDGTAVPNEPKLELAVDGAEDGELVTSARTVPEGAFVGAGGAMFSSWAPSVGYMVETEGWPDVGVGAEGCEVLPPSVLLPVVAGAVVGAAVGANEICAPAAQISPLGLPLGSIDGIALGVAVVLSAPRPLSVLLYSEGAEEEANGTDPLYTPPVGLPVGCAVGLAAGRTVGLAVASVLLVSDVGGNWSS